MDKTGIDVAQYLTELPSKEILEAHLRKAIAIFTTRGIQKILADCATEAGIQ